MPLKPEIAEARGIPITADDAYEFFKDRGASVECEICRVTDWSVVPNVSFSHIATVLTTCRNCGNMRLHAQIVLQLWKRDRAAS